MHNRIESFSKEWNEDLTRVQAKQRMHEEKDRENSTRLAPLHEQVECAAREAEEARAGAEKAVADFNARVAEQERKIEHFRDRGDHEKANKLRKQLDRALSKRRSVLQEGCRQLVAQWPDQQAPERDLMGASEREADRRHKAEIRRLELEQARCNLENEKMAAAELRRWEELERREEEEASRRRLEEGA